MRKANTGIVKLFNSINNIFSLQNLPFLSISNRFRNYHLNQPFNGEVKPHRRLVNLLQHCSTLQSLEATKSLHALTIITGPNSAQPIFLNNNIISLYESLGYVRVARKLFDEMPEKNSVSYNTMIGVYSRDGDVEEAWSVFSEMRNCGFVPTQYTFGGLLSCVCLDVYRGCYLQALIVKGGLLYVDAVAGTALAGMFGRNGCLDEAVRAFEDMPSKNLVTWNSIISLFGHHGYGEECFSMFRELMRIEVSLSECTLVGVLTGFVWEDDLESGEQIHGLVIKNGLVYAVSVANSLVNMYVKCSASTSAEKMFEAMPVRDIVSWNIIIGLLAKSDKPGEALELLLKMYQDGFLPNMTTYVSLINSCTRLKATHYGESIHAKLIRKRFESDVFVGSSLVDFYAKCDRLEDAHSCFEEIHEKNVVSWNALILGYSNIGSSTSMFLLGEMFKLGYRPNECSFSTVIKASFKLELQQIHSLVMKMGYRQNEYVSSSLISSYAKNGLINDALIFVGDMDMPLPVVPSNVIAGVYNRTGQYYRTQELYSVLKEPDIVSWNILIAACSRNGDYKEVFELFGHMQIGQVHPDNYTYVSLLSVCTRLCNLDLGRTLHGLIIKSDFESCDTFVCNVMIDMYGKCGSLESSMKIFDEMIDKNVVSWTAVVSALGLHGHAYEAVEKFREMEMMGFKPDGVAFVAVLSACGYVGLVKEGMELFGYMKPKYKVEPEMDHYLLVVDLLARYGHLEEAEHLITQMPFPPNALIWRSFLEGCKRQRTLEDLALETCMDYRRCCQQLGSSTILKGRVHALIRGNAGVWKHH